jgi:hypothetical protein
MFLTFLLLGLVLTSHRGSSPDFLWLVYVSELGALDDRGRVVDDYEEEAVFRPAAEARGLELSDQSRVFLDAALSRAGR